MVSQFIDLTKKNSFEIEKQIDLKVFLALLEKTFCHLTEKLIGMFYSVCTEKLRKFMPFFLLERREVVSKLLLFALQLYQ